MRQFRITVEETCDDKVVRCISESVPFRVRHGSEWEDQRAIGEKIGFILSWMDRSLLIGQDNDFLIGIISSCGCFEEFDTLASLIDEWDGTTRLSEWVSISKNKQDARQNE